MQLKNLVKSLFVSFTLLSTSSAFAAVEDDIKKNTENFVGEKVKSVVKTNYGDLYEVFLQGGDLIYTDKNNSFYLVSANIVDPKSKTNVTAERLKKLTAIDFSKLDFNNAIKQVRGNGKRVMATFEDPNCGYCKRLAKTLHSVKDTTIYVFLYPILSPDSLEKSKQIWCSKDRSKAWNDWMVNGIKPSGNTEKCDVTAIDKNREFGIKNGVRGTPSIFFADGVKNPGALPLEEINKQLEKSILTSKK